MTKEKLMIDFLIEIDKTKKVCSLEELFAVKPSFRISISDQKFEFFVWGDPVLNRKYMDKLPEKPDIMFLINNIYGHFYFILLDKRESTIIIGNSLFSILPVYIKEEDSNLWISNSPLMLQEKGDRGKFNKRFILENILFNYPLFNQTFYNNVILLPANNYIRFFNGRVQKIIHTEIEDFFTNSPLHWKKAAGKISGIFIEASEKYFNDESYYSSLTGGFDGRTLAACGLFHNKKFSTYCFGKHESIDMQIAGTLSEKAALKFKGIGLEKTYIAENSKNCGLDFVVGSNGTASFSRAHYLYAAEELSKDSQYFISGNFGSEILRAPHEPGVVVSSNLLHLIKSGNFDEGLAILESAPGWNWIFRASFKEEWESLKEDIKTLSWFAPGRGDLSKNQHFYRIIFTEVFRKYFGAELVNQFRFLANRTPFLDIVFLKEILGTGLAGVNSDFLTANPLKRFKGQVLYAHIIKKTFPAFGKEITDKGYPPEYLLSTGGVIKLARSYAGKLIEKGRIINRDPYSVNSAFIYNRNFWECQPVDEVLFNKENIIRGINNPWEIRDSLFIALSQAWFFNSVNEIIKNGKN